jgi:membrane-anchored protein YejM (alkaline phosphatase superfamily)
MDNNLRLKQHPIIIDKMVDWGGVFMLLSISIGLITDVSLIQLIQASVEYNNIISYISYLGVAGFLLGALLRLLLFCLSRLAIILKRQFTKKLSQGEQK